MLNEGFLKFINSLFSWHKVAGLCCVCSLKCEWCTLSKTVMHWAEPVLWSTSNWFVISHFSRLVFSYLQCKLTGALSMVTLSTHRGRTQFNIVPSKIIKQNFSFQFTPLKPPQDHPFLAQYLFPTTPVFPTDVLQKQHLKRHIYNCNRCWPLSEMTWW